MSADHRRWCSERCRKQALHEFSLANDPVYQRRAVWKHDRGVCATCSRDTLKLQHLLRAATKDEKVPLYHKLLQEGYDRYRLDRFMLWEVDHIVSVIEGDGGTGLENLQTLCSPCHKQKTSVMMRHRRNEQKGLRDLFD